MFKLPRFDLINMADDVQIRAYRPGDETQIVELLQLVFKGWPHFDLEYSAMDHWYWKFRDNPTGKNNIALGVVGDRIIACDHGFFNYMRIGDRSRLVRQGVDAAVHPDFRGKGIYSKTGKFKDELDFLYKVEMVYSFTSVKLFKDSRKKKGLPVFPWPIIRLIRVKDVDVFINSITEPSYSKKLYKKYGFKIMNSLNRFFELFSRPVTSSSSVEVSDVEKFDQDIDLFYDKVKIDYKLITDKTHEYLNWRYRDPRGGKYIVKQAKENGEIIGYIALSVNRYNPKSPIGYVMELCTLKNKVYASSILISEALKYFDSEKINVVEYMIVKGHPYEGMFKKLGYVDVKNDNSIDYDFYKDGIMVSDRLDVKPDEILFQVGDTDWR
jgi:hypothetical protein